MLYLPLSVPPKHWAQGLVKRESSCCSSIPSSSSRARTIHVFPSKLHFSITRVRVGSSRACVALLLNFLAVLAAYNFPAQAAGGNPSNHQEYIWNFNHLHRGTGLSLCLSTTLNIGPFQDCCLMPSSYTHWSERVSPSYLHHTTLEPLPRRSVFSLAMLKFPWSCVTEFRGTGKFTNTGDLASKAWQLYPELQLHPC